MMGPREVRSEALKMDMNENDERPHHVFIYPTTIHTNRRSSSRRKSAASRTLTTLDYDSERFLQAENDMERDLDQLIALKNWEELEEGNWDTCHRYV